MAMKALGLNPTETEIQDLINEVERNGFIYYPAFCRVIMRKLREDDEENFRRELFRVLIGPKKYPDNVPAQLININKEILTFEQVSRRVATSYEVECCRDHVKNPPDFRGMHSSITIEDETKEKK